MIIDSLGSIYLRHTHFWSKRNVMLLLQSIAFFAIALLVQHIAYNYIDYHVVGTPVGDLLLNDLPIVNLNFFIVQGALILTILIVILFILGPQYLSFSIKSFGVFLIVRSFFISLTHLGVNAQEISLNSHSIGFGIYDFLYNSKNDFFFSGHTGAPFLFALIFWKEKLWRYVFFATAFIFGISVLLTHAHYSIDVFAAPFMTYSIFIISKRLFKKDFALTQRPVA